MRLVHTYIAYRVSISVVYIVVVYYTCRIDTVTCVCVTHTNPLTRYPVEGVCTLTSANVILKITYGIIYILLQVGANHRRSASDNCDRAIRQPV